MRKVVFSKRASQRLEKLLEFLELEWSARVAAIFDTRQHPDKLKKDLN
jgi:hypothetical protein